ncbi:MAG: recombinase family protein [Campylobacteraceae bacterium]|nr:recombinase family protein [Campylobacteraceae bacterium]
MAIILLKNIDCQENIATQQEHILKYALTHKLNVDVSEVDNFSSESILEERKWLRGFLRALKPKEVVLTYDLLSLTPRVDELVKIFECILKRDISLHICSKNIIISNKTPLLSVLHLLTKQREANLNPKKSIHQGRPKGRMSRSKFDDNRTGIVSMLEQDKSVSEIAKVLKLSRSSLKDYINSRALKDLAKVKKTLPNYDNNINERSIVNTPQTKEKCALIEQN